MENFKNYGVQELNNQEINETNGGDLGLALTVIGACIYIYNEWDDYEAGFKEGYESTRNK